MGATKELNYTEEQKRLAALFKALAHPARIAILQMLMQHRTCYCGKVTDMLPLAQATVSQHLKELKLAGFIKGIVEGKQVCYCLDEKKIGQIRALLGGFLDQLAGNDRSCC